MCLFVCVHMCVYFCIYHSKIIEKGSYRMYAITKLVAELEVIFVHCSE